MGKVNNGVATQIVDLSFQNLEHLFLKKRWCISTQVGISFNIDFFKYKFL